MTSENNDLYWELLSEDKQKNAVNSHNVSYKVKIGHNGEIPTKDIKSVLRFPSTDSPELLKATPSRKDLEINVIGGPEAYDNIIEHPSTEFQITFPIL